VSPRLRADLALVVVTLLWGITFPLIRSALADLDPYQFVGWRFLIATVAFLPLVLAHPASRRGLGRAFLPGLLLGSLAWTSYISQTIGLQTIPAGRAAFITGLSVILVPLLSPVFRAGQPRPIELVAAAVATAGLYLLTVNSGDGSAGSWLSVGDLWILVCASSYAIYIHVLQILLRRNYNENSLAFTQVLGIGVFAVSILFARGEVRIVMSQAVLVALAVCALLATVGTFWLQTRYQGRSTPQRVALIFALEPVFATLFAYLLLGETLSGRGAFGAAVILFSVVGVELSSALRARSRTAR
jgi:drug/metabolite transporter (DMT)-like permease